MVVKYAGLQIFEQANTNVNKDVYGTIIFNVKAFGAKGDNESDDTAKIQKAIDAAEANEGGTVFFPPGEYLYTALTVQESNVVLQGAGWSSILKQTTTTGNGFEIYNPTKRIENVFVLDLCFDTAVTKTSHSAITFLNVIRPIVDRCFFKNQHSALQVNVFGAARVSNTTIEGAKDFGILINAGDDILISDCIITNTPYGSVQTGSKGIYWRSGGGIFLHNIDVVMFDYGLYVKPEAGENAAWGFFTNFLADTGGAAGIFADGSLGLVRALHSTGGWTSSNSGVGIRINDVDGFFMTSDRCLQNHSHGMYVGANCRNLNVQNCFFICNNTDNILGNGSGIFIEPDISDFIIQGNAFVNVFPGFGVVNQRYGVYISSGNSSRFSIQGNRFEANQLGAIIQNSVGNNIIIKDNVSDESNVITAASDIGFPTSHDYIVVNGNTNINNVGTSWAGRKVILKFTGTPTVTRGFNFKLNGSDFVASNNAILELISDGTYWQEVSRSSNS